MIVFLTPSLVIFDYVDRKTLNNDQMEFLELVLNNSIQKLKSTGILPPGAIKKTWDPALNAQGSYEINCIASILDMLMPQKNILRVKRKFLKHYIKLVR